MISFEKDCRQWWHHHVEKDAFLSPSEIVILRDLTSMHVYFFTLIN